MVDNLFVVIFPQTSIRGCRGFQTESHPAEGKKY